MQLGCVQQAAGVSKQVKELWGQTQALTWAAEAEGKRDRKETDGAAGLCATGGGEGAAGADASAHGQQRQSVHGVVRPLGIPVHLNHIYADEVSLSAMSDIAERGTVKQNKTE